MGVAVMADSQKKKEIWVMFDLGETIVTSNHNHDQQTAKFHYLPGAQDYIQKVREKGFKTGLIVNIPERWGTTEPEKMAMLKKFIVESWDDTIPFDWTPFEGLIIIPMFDKERKPAPDLFLKTIELSHKKNAEFMYMGEDDQEIAAAKACGIASYKVGTEPGFYISIDKIESFIHENHK